MNFKKIAAGITAIACCAGLAPQLPLLRVKTYAAQRVSDTFEVNYDGWYGDAESVNLIAEPAAGNHGSRGMLVSGRLAPSDGASSSKGFYLEGGIKYAYSVWVYSETAELFRLTLRCQDPETEAYTTETLVEEEVPAGTWTELSATYRAPKDSVDFCLSLNTDSTADFRFDDVLVTEKVKESTQTVAAATADQGLKNAFASYFRVGSVLNGNTVKNSSITANIIKDNNSITCENETKPDATLAQSRCSGTNIGVSLNSAASIMDFCSKNGIGMRGHTLVWHSQTPQWFFKENFDANANWVSKSVMEQRLESYIKNMFTAIQQQYPSLDLYAYDVANECVSDDSGRTANNGGSRVPGYGDGKSPWVQIYGNNDFVTSAFTYARKYAPSSCKLFYNDYNEYWDHKRDCIYNMCKNLYTKGVLDGVGMQSHINADASGFSGTSAYVTAMKKFASIGCEVQVTELDISIESGKFSLQQQASKYKDVFQAAMDVNKSGGKVTAVCIWGPNDANTWIKSENAPLLYNTANQPKPAYSTLMGMIPESEWDQTDPVEPDKNGWYFHSTFEGAVDSWAGRGAATVETSGRTHYAGSEAMLVSGREEAWNGAALALSTNPFAPGSTFSFSANVMYLDGGATDTFYLKLEYTDANGDAQYPTIAEGIAVKGEWVQLANTSFTIPSDATNARIYVETAETINNFYVDEVIGAVDGTVIDGAGEQDKLMLGDVNCDGAINGLDLTAAKRGLLSGFSRAASEITADVDQSGKVDLTDITLLQDFLLCKIEKFPVAEKVIDTAAMEAKFANMTLTKSYKKESENNPLFTQRFGADPGVMEYNGRMYVYTTNDVIERDGSGKVVENTYGQINKINCISSADLVNWTDHGAIPVAGSNGIAKWASNSWAPCAAHKTINGKEKFFLYFCNGGNGVSVLSSDSPTGPWTDPLGKGLITRSTPNCAYVTWLFDPAILVDDDGTGYLYFGGGVPEGQQAHPKNARVVKLGADMISLAGEPQTIDAPYHFEDSGINKIGNTYYYSYCTNWDTGGNPYGFGNADIAYMTSSSPMGPFTYAGTVFKNQGNFFGLYGNNHHSIVGFKDKLYLLYHNRPVEAAMGISGNYRSPQINEVTMSGGKFNSVKGTMAGMTQLQTLSPYDKVQAETMSHQAGINVSGVGDTVVTEIDKGDWIKVTGVAFTQGAKSLTVRGSSKSGSVIKVCSGSATGKVVSYVELSSSMAEVTVPLVSSVSGTQDLYFVFSGDAEFDWWSFS